VQSPAAVAHPFDDGGAAVLERSIDATGRTLGRDAAVYRRIMAPLVADADGLVDGLLGPLRLPRHPLALARFGVFGLLPARWLAERFFRGEAARGLFAGLAAHSIQPLEHPLTAAPGLVLGLLGHAVGWPMARGGSQRISDAMAA